MEELIGKMLGKKVWAVIGATTDESKFGNKIMKALKNKGYEVYGVNPKSDAFYKCVKDIPVSVDCVDMVVNPFAAFNSLDDIVNSGVKYVWFQPGTYEDKVIQKAKSLGLNVVYDHCVLIEMKVPHDEI